MKFLDELKNVLRSDERFVGENNEIIKTKVADAARASDGLLLKSLLNNELLRDSLFTKVDDIYVFDSNKFVWILESKEFLPDSYTIYKNKIGLVDNQNNLISQKQDVSLVWPYKDCVLEGGQTKEDQKRDEIFYNETLAPDQVNRLLAPKVFGNAKRYTAEGIEEDIEFTCEDNLVIKGNNLFTISCLLKKFREKIKCIYIDPPYNTGGDANIFSYNNSFNHSSWLTFIKNRLEIAKDLLSENGFITIAIDHNELFYLGALCDEIFERENFISIITVQHNPKGRNQAKFISSNSEFLLLYAKNKEKATLENVAISDDVKKTFTERDEVGLYRWEEYIRARTEWSRESRPENWYPIYVSNDFKKISSEKFKGAYELFPRTNTGDFSWKNIKEKFDSLNQEEGYFRAREVKGKIILEHKYRENEVLKNVWIDKKYQSEFNGTNLLKDLIGKNKFSYPKSVYAVQDIIKITSGDRDIVLDFFSGSGTTAHAVLLANHEQGYNRKFILCEQLGEHIKITKKRLKNLLINKQDNEESKYLVNGSFKSFVYCELLEDNESLIRELEQSTESQTIKNVLKRAIEYGKLVPSVLPDDLKETESDFDTLSLEEQKRLAMELLDKNKLYINLSDIEDESFEISEADKKFTKSFYNLD